MKNNSNTQSPIPTSESATAVTENDNNTPTVASTTTLSTMKPTNIQRPRMSSYNTIHTDKYSHSLRDFPLHHFNRNLTIEKATFDPLPHALSQDTTSSSSSVSHLPPPQMPTPQKKDDSISLIGTSPRSVQQPPSSTASSLPPSHLLMPTPIAAATTAAATAEPWLSDEKAASASPSLLPPPLLPPPSSPSRPLSALTSGIQNQASHSPPRTPALNKGKPSIKKEIDRRTTKKKKRKLPPVNGTATPSEVFHRNLVDAVSNVEDSDEYEQYVYPYSHHEQTSSSAKKKQLDRRQQYHLPSNYRRSTAPPSSSYSSTPTSTLSLQPPPTSGSRGFLTDLLNYQHRSMSSLLRWNPDQQQYQHSYTKKQTPLYQLEGADDDGDFYYMPVDEESGKRHHRPKLRSHVMDHPRTSSALPQPWSHEASSSDDGDDDDEEDDIYRQKDHGEHVYLLRHHPGYQRKYRQSGTSCVKVVRNLCLSFLLFLVLMMILTVYRSEPLVNTSASMAHILASDKELIFDLTVKANNWNWWTVRVNHVDLSIFAFSEVVPSNGTFGVDPVEFIGSYQQFDQPLSFPSSVMLGKQQAIASTQIRIKSPGADISGNQRWSRMIRYPYGLVTRGVMKYRPFPLFGLSSQQSIAICVVVHANPTISSSPPSFVIANDHGYCSHYSTPFI